MVQQIEIKKIFKRTTIHAIIFMMMLTMMAALILSLKTPENASEKLNKHANQFIEIQKR